MTGKTEPVSLSELENINVEAINSNHYERCTTEINDILKKYWVDIVYAHKVRKETYCTPYRYVNGINMAIDELQKIFKANGIHLQFWWGAGENGLVEINIPSLIKEGVKILTYSDVICSLPILRC